MSQTKRISVAGFMSLQSHLPESIRHSGTPGRVYSPQRLRLETILGNTMTATAKNTRRFYCVMSLASTVGQFPSALATNSSAFSSNISA